MDGSLVFPKFLHVPLGVYTTGKATRYGKSYHSNPY